ncbi:MAG: tetratricopeptide repeat protein [Pseudomonadota bacterium]
MNPFHRRLRPLTIAVAAVLTLGACAQWRPGLHAEGEQQPPPAAAQKPVEAPVANLDAESGPELPKQELTSDLLYAFLLAEIAAQRGQGAVSAQTYADLALRTRDPRIARRALDIAVAARSPDLAIQAAQVWLEADPNSLEARRRLAALLLATQRLDEARPHLEHLLAAGAVDKGEAFTQLARLIAGNPDREESLRVVRELAAAYPDVPEAHFAVAHVAGQAGQFDLALQEIRAALRLRPDWEMGVLLEAQLLQKSQGNEAARARLAEFLAANPRALDIRLNYARLLVAERQYEEARGEFEALLRDNPLNSDALYAAALLSLQLKDYGAAERYLKRLLELNYRDRDTVALYLGQIAEEQKRYDEALDWYEDITGGEHYLQAKTRQAHVMAKKGDLDGARRFLQQIKAPSNQQRVQLILAEAHLLRDAGHYKEAFDVISRGLEKLPNDPDLLYDHAMMAEKLDRLDVLEASLRKLIRLHPEHPHAYNALGYSFADRNIRLPEARKLIEKAHQLAPDDAFILDSMGWVLFRQGEYEAALKYLERAYALRQDAEIAAHLGEVLWVLGRRDEARRIWSEARRVAPDNEALLKTIQRLQP